MMTMEQAIDALGSGGSIVVVSRSGKLYHLEAAVIEASARENNPLLYGWPVKPHLRAPENPVWFRAKNVRIAETDDQINI